jgi:hypothetical protein
VDSPFETYAGDESRPAYRRRSQTLSAVRGWAGLTQISLSASSSLRFSTTDESLPLCG